MSDVQTCIELICYHCARGVALICFDGDNNLYHTPCGSPCRAYKMRRHFHLLDDVENVSLRTYGGPGK